MATIMMRSFAEFMGFQWPREVASIINGQVVTFAQIKEERVARQRQRLDFISGTCRPRWRAAHVWTFYVPGMIYGGWHLYLRTIRDDWWIPKCDSLAVSIMKMFPCGLLPISENFYVWKKAFAETYSKGERGGQKQGLVIVWVDVVNHHRPEQIYLETNISNREGIA